MNFLLIAAVSFLSGIMASMGLGGGMVLILYLTIFTNATQFEAQGINLIFFIPVSVLALILHTKRKLVNWKTVFLPIISGTASVIVFSIAATKTDSAFIQKAFAVFIIVVGIIQFFKKEKK